MIDHEDLDRVAAESLVAAEPAAVVNVAASISGRYPNVGPLLLAAAGIPLLDGCGDPASSTRVPEGTVADARRHGAAGRRRASVAKGTRQTMDSLEAAYGEASRNMGPELEAFVENTLTYIGKEAHLLPARPARDPRRRRRPRRAATS